jgi:hypothetical protein
MCSNFDPGVGDGIDDRAQCDGVALVLDPAVPVPAVPAEAGDV